MNLIPFCLTLTFASFYCAPIFLTLATLGICGPEVFHAYALACLSNAAGMSVQIWGWRYMGRMVGA